MKKISLFTAGFAAILLCASGVTAQRWEAMRATALARFDRPGVKEGATLLPNGWVLTPAGRQIPTGDLPLSMTLAPNGRFLLVSTGGYAPCQILAIDTANEQVQNTQTVDDLWEGMAFGEDGRNLFVSGGGRGLLWNFDYAARGGDLIRRDPVIPAGLIGRDAPYALHVKSAPKPNAWLAGVAAGHGVLYTLNNQASEILAVDPSSGAIKSRAATDDHPNAVAISPDGATVWVTNQGSATVGVYAAADLTKIGVVAVGTQPVALLFSHDGKRVYVANSGGNTVSVVDTVGKNVTETIRTTLTPHAPAGSTPNALALTPDDKRLFVTNADNNDVAVVDVSDPGNSRVLGFIPTGWYPTSIAVSPNGRKLFVGNGKGLRSKPSFPRMGGGVGLDIYNKPGESYGPDHKTAITFDYISSLVSGSVSVIDMPDDTQLAAYTAQVVRNCPYRDSLLVEAVGRPNACAIPARVGDPSPIKHILYIIKENRTYDQMFGDIKEGNGDPSLVLFGANVTPNHHALAHDYVLFDNLYCNGEVSEDGHQWCNAALASDWTEKVYPGNYATPSRGDPAGDDAVTASAGGYLWDECAAHGLSYRTYGEFTNFHSDKDSAPVASSASPHLRGHVSLGWEMVPTGLKGRDYKRVDAFIDELKTGEKSGEWPNYMVMSLPEDHTVGLTPGRPTPWAAVGSNDLALGRIVDAVSHSRFWASTAIFVIEDDAQAGPDHVDAHRTVGLVISPFIKRHFVDHTLYTTASFLRTMELALGLPPMTQYDAGATPLFASFVARPNLAAYTARPAQVDLAAINPPRGAGATASLKMDFSHVDRCDPDALNRLLWTAIRGPHAPYPGSVTGTSGLVADTLKSTAHDKLR